ncbi:hypothetical protein D3C85_1795610 [compost metagenome]
MVMAGILRLAMASCLIPTLPLGASMRLMMPRVMVTSPASAMVIPSIWDMSCPSWFMIISACACMAPRPSSRVKVSVL